MNKVSNLIKNVLEGITYKYSLKYSYYKKKNDTKTFPVYLFETSSEDTTEENHTSFIQNLKDKAIKADVVASSIANQVPLADNAELAPIRDLKESKEVNYDNFINKKSITY